MDDAEWRKWMNQHFYVRQGVSFKEMTEPQREAAFGLLRAALSAKGLKLSRDIMKLNHTLGELDGDNFDEYGEWLYCVTVMGEPSATEPWGWQLDGHHSDRQLLRARRPGRDDAALLGLRAGVAARRQVQGHRRPAGRAAEGPRAAQCARRRRSAEGRPPGRKTGNDNLAEAFKDNVVLDYAGLRAAEMTAAQRQQLLELIGEYVGNMDDGHARVKMERGQPAPRRHLVRLDRRHASRTASSTTGSTAR